ncbi:hypothetical protein Lalb_Chr07g0189741 [Lupinus albus]|uniref:Uncharacterized protein n=1 Tax=Lupinus albus TaxID=3870 RepID=A0A6A4QAU3_LUPAL|nr:hypothetical protein Lalb_Chr07g0189741 [Lupinus albus]
MRVLPLILNWQVATCPFSSFCSSHSIGNLDYECMMMLLDINLSVCLVFLYLVLRVTIFHLLHLSEYFLVGLLVEQIFQRLWFLYMLHHPV